MSKIVLIDGHSILNRAFYGVPMLTGPSGLPTNAVYGFLNILFKILDEENPDYLTVAFDVKAPTFRHEMYAEYKGTRKPMPEELHRQVPVIKEVLTAMGIQLVEKAGYEADDILGTIAKRSEKEGMEVSLVSGDRDLLQIASEHIKIRIPKTKGGKTEIEDYYAADVEKAYRVTPEQFIELKALMGDTADNIPGVPKIGEKTATELMAAYGSIENIYEHIEEISKKSIRESLLNNRELADLSKKLAAIDTDADIEFSYDKARLGELLTPEAYDVFKKLSFKNLLSRFEHKPEPEKESEQDIQVDVIKTRRELEDAVRFVIKGGSAAVRFIDIQGQKKGDLGTTGSGQMFLQLEDSTACFGCVLYGNGSENRVYFAENGGGLTRDDILEQLEQLLTAPGFELNCFDIKNDYGSIFTDKREQDIRLSSHELTENLFDCKIAAYLINPLKNNYEIADIAGEYLNCSLKSRSEAFGKADMQSVYSSQKEECVRFLAMEARVLGQAGAILAAALAQNGMDKLFRELEMPLTYVLYDMEREGILVKPEELKAYGEALTGRIGELEAAIHEAAGESFNINSPKQLGEILFDKLKLPGGKKTKKGYSTAADVLDKLAPDYPIVRDILEYRGLAKLKSTYADGLAAFIDGDSKIHTSFNQTITATGRLSSTEPNLQNIPMRMELGRRIRKVFIPQEGCVFMDADYSQIELRVLAHMSGDAQLIEAYQQNEDIHRITAAKVFHTPFEEVTDLQRRNAKAVNFGIVYGISSFGLSQDLSISPKEAKAYIDEYFKTYPGIKEFLDRLVADAKSKGYCETMFGRKRPVPELKSSNFMQRSFGERVAMNSPIQGTAADIIKIAMLNVYDALRRKGLKSKLILQIHDELLIETRQDEVDEVRKVLTDEMQNVCKLSVKLETDLHTGTNWYEAK
ncbi:MAG: DNA polymerase I [Lachnospiraceae bacterium]|nr:DNA polymerase I [Lachnospiraceae bacterium]